MFAIQFRTGNPIDTMYFAGRGVLVNHVSGAEKFSHLELLKDKIKTFDKPSMTARGNVYLDAEIIEIERVWNVVRIVE